MIKQIQIVVIIIINVVIYKVPIRMRLVGQTLHYIQLYYQLRSCWIVHKMSRGIVFILYFYFCCSYVNWFCYVLLRTISWNTSHNLRTLVSSLGQRQRKWLGMCWSRSTQFTVKEDYWSARVSENKPAHHQNALNSSRTMIVVIVLDSVGMLMRLSRYVTDWMAVATPLSGYRWIQPRNSWQRKSLVKLNCCLGSTTKMLSGMYCLLCLKNDCSDFWIWLSVMYLNPTSFAFDRNCLLNDLLYVSLTDILYKVMFIVTVVCTDVFLMLWYNCKFKQV